MGTQTNTDYGIVFQNALLQVQPILVALLIVTICLLILLTPQTLRFVAIPVVQKHPRAAKIYLLCLLVGLMLILLLWYINTYVVPLPFLLFPFALFLLIIAVAFGVLPGFLAYLIITFFFIYYLVAPRYQMTGSFYHNFIVMYALGSLGAAVLVGILVRRYQELLGLQLSELRQINWRTKARLATKAEEEAVLKAIYKGTLSIGSSALSVAAVSGRITDEVRHLIPSPYAGLVFTHDGGEISCEAFVPGFKTEAEQKEFLGFLKKIIADQRADRKKISSLELPRVELDSKRKFLRAIDKVLLAPITLQNHFGMILLLRTFSDEQFSEKDKHKLALFAAHATLALRNAEHHDDLESLMLARDQFTSAVAHELKTPLSTIKLYAQLQLEWLRGDTPPQLKKSKPDAVEFRKGLQIIDQEVNRLTSLIDSLVDFARFQSRKIKLEKKPFSLNRSCKTRIDVLQKLYPNHTFRFVSTVAHTPIVADQIRIEQVITNLLSNAAKYSQPGKSIELRLTKRQANYRIHVKDYGVGVAKEDIDRIFEPFYQAKPGLTENKLEKGLGLGLYISKSIVTLHGGKIWVESTVNKGSTFFVELPLVAS